MKVNIYHEIDVIEDILPELDDQQQLRLFEELAENYVDDKEIVKVATNECYEEDILEHISENVILEYVKERLGYTISEEVKL